MKGFIEVKEDSFDDTIEHLHRVKAIICKIVKKLSESSDIYDHEDDEREYESRGRRMRRSRDRYDY